MLAQILLSIGVFFALAILFEIFFKKDGMLSSAVMMFVFWLALFTADLAWSERLSINSPLSQTVDLIGAFPLPIMVFAFLWFIIKIDNLINGLSH